MLNPVRPHTTICLAVARYSRRGVNVLHSGASPSGNSGDSAHRFRQLIDSVQSSFPLLAVRAEEIHLISIAEESDMQAISAYIPFRRNAAVIADGNEWFRHLRRDAAKPLNKIYKSKWLKLRCPSRNSHDLMQGRRAFGIHVFLRDRRCRLVFLV